MQRKLSIVFVAGSFVVLVYLLVATSLPAQQSVSGAHAAVVLSSNLEPPTATATDSPTATATDTDTPTSTSTPTTTDTATDTVTLTPTQIPPTATRYPTRPPAPALPVPQLDATLQRVFDLTNAQRTAQGLAPLRLNQNLVNSASWFAADMAAHNVLNLTHVDSLGRDAPTRILAFGYPWSWYGENIAMGYPSADAVVSAWMGSPGHRENILNGIFTEIGVGHAVRNGRNWWVQDFGRR